MANQETAPLCPLCEQNDQVAKVSHLYLSARERKQPSQPFAPPSGNRQSTRPIHPDMVVGALTIIAVIFLINILQSQQNMLLPVLLVLAAFYAFYFFMRKNILKRYQAERNQEASQRGNIEAAIGDWMKLYYCARDKGVFDPQEQELIPLDQMRAYLFSKQKKGKITS